MPRYRVHILGPSGKAIGVGEFDGTNSQTAQEHIKRLAGDLDSELWQLVRRSGQAQSPAQTLIRPNRA